METLIPRQDFTKYVFKNYYLTESQKKMILHYYCKKFSFYVLPNSNKQIYTFYKEAYENNNLEEIMRLQMLFNHFCNIRCAEKIMNYLKIAQSITDYEIIYFMKNEPQEIIKNYSYNKWTYAIQYLSMIYYGLTKAINTEIKFIDICCGKSTKTKIFQKSFDIPKENTYCTDILLWGPYDNNENMNKINYQFKLIIENGKLDYEDNYFDLTTCIVSLHHIENLNDFIKEIYRITKPNGYFLLIDHSVFTDYDRLFINIQHLLYSVFYDNKQNCIENPDYIYCYNMYEWNYILFKNNFLLKKQEQLPFGNPFQYNYDNIFYSFYQKR